ncbi:aldehyde dehydrogenase family protein [Phytohabitans kaempferiae]|uniref:Aldehyde dehydrogenase family protein n=1 Tax=Phytohabitans kaempferiae TaxID=1620943 RepID=A0ABV6LYX1_9ACTN
MTAHRIPEHLAVPGMLVDGKLVPASDGAELPVVDPTTEEVLGAIPDATPSDVDAAVTAAAAASPTWRDLRWAERARILREVADVVQAHADDFALLDALDGGNTRESMRADAVSAAEEIRYFAGVSPEAKGQTIPSGPDALTYTEFVPYPVVARIVPFNHPLKFAAAKSAAPLAAGCAVVLKPGENSSLSALHLGRLVRDLLPPGVFNVVTGRGDRAGAALAEHPRVPRVAFTGGVPTGQRVLSAAAPGIKHVSLELGGKNPFIVFPDADPVAAAAGAVAAMNFSRSAGQSCGSTSRAFVHRDVAEAFTGALLEKLAGLRVGDPLDPATAVGPLSFRAHYERVLGYLDAGRAEGARLRFGGGRPAHLSRGWFVEPTVFDRVDMSMRIAREEIFGPVLSILEWHDEEVMLADVNAIELGLTGNIWTRDISTAIRTARRVETGYVSVNGTGKRPLGAPFGGFKASGIGKESSLDELLSYGRHKSVTITLG